MKESIENLRAVLVATRPAAPGLESYLSNVAQHAYAITDADVEALIAAGYSEDEIFEQTVAVAIAQGLRRLDAAASVIA